MNHYHFIAIGLVLVLLLLPMMMSPGAVLLFRQVMVLSAVGFGLAAISRNNRRERLAISGVAALMAVIWE